VKQIASFFLPRADRTLYHYTGIGGLLGIVNSRSIWASHIYYLNDSREILHASDVLCKILASKEGALHGEDREFLRQFREWMATFRVTPYHLFVFSLSEEISLLSQWRSYTPHGKGVSLGFPPSVLDSVLRKPGFRIAKCLYENDAHEELLESLLEKVLITFRQNVSSIDTSGSHPSQKYHPFLEDFRGDILQVLAIVKYPAFQEEKEWRVMSPYFPNYTVADVKFREGASMLLPYTELKLPSDGLLFEHVLLGPSQDANLSMSALSTFLSNRGVCNATANSQIPFRKWPAT
jgi:Protein of unknown function (DUF2971)